MDVGQKLRGQGYRVTPQRRLVWDVLRQAEHHLTADEIHARVSATVPEFNVASVYRTLALLAELGVAKEVRLGDGAASWELAHPDDEFHLVCRRCGRVTHHHGTLVEDVRVHLADGHGFVTDSVELVVHGVCSDCNPE
jgi:Fur family ferric uptake transcriptional regulator